MFNINCFPYDRTFLHKHCWWRYRQLWGMVVKHNISKTTGIKSTWLYKDKALRFSTRLVNRQTVQIHFRIFFLKKWSFTCFLEYKKSVFALYMKQALNFGFSVPVMSLLHKHLLNATIRHPILWKSNKFPTNNMQRAAVHNISSTAQYIEKVS